MTNTATRLAAYYAAELSILQAQEARGRDRTLRMAELETVRKGIKELELQQQREQSAAADGRRGGFGYAVADLSGN